MKRAIVIGATSGIGRAVGVVTRRWRFLAWLLKQLSGSIYRKTGS